MKDKSTQDDRLHAASNYRRSRKFTPLSGISSEIKRINPSYINKITLCKVKKKYHTWIRYLNTKSDQDYQQYIRARYKATHAIRKARMSFESKLPKESKQQGSLGLYEQ